MPFRSEAQRRLCWVLKDPKWDCHKWEKETPKTEGKAMRAKKRRCGGFKKDGSPCRNFASLNHLYCHLHSTKNSLNQVMKAKKKKVKKETQ